MGYLVQFHCGVRMGYLHLEGYAWLMLNGGPFQEQTQQWRTYSVIYSCPSYGSHGGVSLRPASLESDTARALLTVAGTVVLRKCLR
jgi:hypothetical protein